MKASQPLENGYTYKPLPRGESSGALDVHGGSIRLLQFSSTPKSLTEKKTLEVTLKPYRLSEDLKFDALSYEWGQSGEVGTVLIDGKGLSIPKSLLLFLKALNAASDARRTLFFADAICIDQQNLQERASQVQLMGQVYTSARRVHIWLGVERAGIGLLFRFCNILRGSETDAKVQGRFHQIFGRHNEAAFQEAVQAFTTCTYWQRLWVIQEILLAKDLLVHCGTYSVYWNALYEGCQRVLLADVWKSRSLPSSSFGSAPDAIAEAIPDDFDHSRYVSLYMQTTSGGPGELAARPQPTLRATRSKRLYTLKDAIALHGLAECTDRHDRVYGLLGLVLRGNDSGYFSADYGEHLVTLFQRVMHQCHADLRTGSIAFCRHLRHVLFDLPFTCHREWLRTGSGMSRSVNGILPASPQYSIVVRYASRLDKQVKGLADKNSGGEDILQAEPELSTWKAGDSGVLWSTIGNVRPGDLIYSIDESCCGVVFRKMIIQLDVPAKRKRSAAIAPLFVGRAIAHKLYGQGEVDHTAMESFLRSEHRFASKLIADRPLLERPGAPWESHVQLSELWDLSCDIEGTEIVSHNSTLNQYKTTRSDSPPRRQQWTGIPRKKPRFDFEWTSGVANSK